MKNAMEIFKQMKLNDIKPDVVTHNCIIGGFSKQGDMKNAMKMVFPFRSKINSLITSMFLAPTVFEIFPERLPTEFVTRENVSSANFSVFCPFSLLLVISIPN